MLIVIYPFLCFKYITISHSFLRRLVTSTLYRKFLYKHIRCVIVDTIQSFKMPSTLQAFSHYNISNHYTKVTFQYFNISFSLFTYYIYFMSTSTSYLHSLFKHLTISRTILDQYLFIAQVHFNFWGLISTLYISISILVTNSVSFSFFHSKLHCS